MYKIKLAAFPNGESRLVMSKLSSGRSIQDQDSPESELPSEIDSLGASPNLTLALNSFPIDEISPQRKRTGDFTLDARRKLLRAGGALARFDPEPNHCVFLTGTLPGGTENALRSMAQYSSEIVKRVKTWVWRRYSDHSLSFYCWELQERGALHLHYLVYVPACVARQRIIDEFRGFWIGLLESITVKSGVDMFEKSYGGTHRYDHTHIQAYAQECYKSVAAYMAKYVGKEAGKGNHKYFPDRWSAVSRPLGRLILEYTEETERVVPGYVDARNLYLRCQEDLWDGERVCYKYRHKVGIGDTTLVYYKDDKESQLCQYSQVSRIMNSKSSVKEYLMNWRTEVLISYCNLRVMGLMAHHFPDWLAFSMNTTSKPESILMESLMESFTECQLPLSRDIAKNALMAQLPFLFCANLNLPTTSTQIVYQNLLAKQRNLMSSRADLNLVLRVEGVMLRNVTKRLSTEVCQYNRSTTKAMGKPELVWNVQTGGEHGNPSGSPYQPLLF